MTAPRRSGAEQATMRGIVVLVVAVIVGVALLAKIPNNLVGSAAAGTAKPKTTTTTGSTTTTITQGTVSPVNTGGTVVGAAHAPGEVKVLVVNAAGQVGVGNKNKELLTTAGFNVIDVKNGKPSIPKTIVYFTDGYQGDATAVKTAVNVPNAQVVQLPAAPIVPEATGANITVAFGEDYQG